MLESHFKAYLDRLKKLPELPPELEMRKAFSSAGWSPAEIEEALAYVKPAPIAPPQPVVPPIVAPAPIPVAPKPVVQEETKPAPVLQQPIAPRAVTSTPLAPLPPLGVKEPSKVSWPAPTPPSEPKAPPAPPAPQPPVQQAAPTTPVIRTMVAPQPQSSATSFIVTPQGTHPEVKSSSSLSRKLVTILLILAILGVGIAYAYVQKIGPFFNAPYSIETLFSGLAEKMFSVDAYSYTASLSLETEPLEASTPLYHYDFSTEPYFNVPQPLDLKASVTSEGAAENISSGAVANSRVHLAGSFSATDIAGEFDLDVVKKGDTVYIKVRKIPSLLLFSEVNFQPLLNKWVALSLTEFGEFADVPIGELTEELNGTALKNREQQKKFVKKIAEIMDKHKVLAVQGNPSFDSVNGIGAYRYSFKINIDGLVAAGQEVMIDFAKTVQPLTLDQEVKFKAEMMRELSSPEFAEARKFIDYINQNGAAYLWVDAETGYPLQTAFSLRFAPKGVSGLKDKQLHLEYIITLADINKSQVIEAPSEALPYEDAVILLSGKTKQSFLHEKQDFQIRSLRNQLEYYYSIHGSYPETLQEVMSTKAWQDVVAGVPYLYFPGKTDYKILYQIALPPKEAKPSYYSVVEKTYPGDLLTIKYVDGTNTATAKALSSEAAFLAKKDTDKDGTTDVYEEYVGTSKTKRDPITIRW